MFAIPGHDKYILYVIGNAAVYSLMSGRPRQTGLVTNQEEEKVHQVGFCKYGFTFTSGST